MMMAMKKKTIKDITDITGYSRSTVSRVITGKGYVDSKVREEIQNTMKEIGYVPQQKHVSKEVRDMIMVIACQLDSDVQMKMVMTIKKILQKHNLRTAIISAEFDSNTAYEYIEYARKKNFGGVITLGVLDTPEFREACKKLTCPIVFLNQTIDGIDASSVQFVEKQISEQASKYLVNMGHRKIAFLGGYANAVAIRDREQGFRRVMEEAGIQEATVIHNDFNEESGKRFADQLIDTNMPYTAVICATDILCYGFVKEMERRHIQIPEQISVIGFGGSIFEKTIDPRITVVDYDFESVGKSLAELLIEHIEKPLMKTKVIYYEPKLLIRSSVKEAG